MTAGSEDAEAATVAADEGFTTEELARLPEFYHPTVSPDGSEVALYYDGTGRNEAYVLDVETGDRRQLGEGDVPRNARWPLAWDGSGDRLLFHRDEDGDEQNDVHAIDRTGHTEQVVEVDGQAILFETTDDGRFVFYASDEAEQMNLWRYDTNEGTRTQLTAFDQPVYVATLGPDDERIALSANESADLENRDVYVADVDGEGLRPLDVGSEGTEVYPVEFHPADPDRLLIYDNSRDLGRAGVYHFDTDEVEWVSAGEGDTSDYEESPDAFTPDGDGVVVTRTRDAAEVLVHYDLATGEGRELDLPDGVGSVAGGEAFTADGRLVCSHSATDTRKRLLTYDLATDEVRTLFESASDDVDTDRFVAADYVTYESTDGLEIGALLYDSGERPSPAVVMVHGGPHSMANRGFDLYSQFLVSRGYTVLKPNYRGSTGQGREFKNRIHGDWGGKEQEDVAAGAEWLAERAWIDGDRLAVFGGSYGGYSTYCQLTMHPEHWKTGVAWIGITDLHAMFEESMPHFKSMLRQQMGDPEENHGLWRERSPIEHVDAIEAPIGIVHGVNDVRCPVSQARRFRDALEARGWEEGPDGDFEYEELGEEGHGSTDQEQKVRAFTLVGEFLDRRL